ncbi:1-deoxy-D-xylulose-5-phosphate synthase [Ferrithrix thermotolerans DSM 19514]|uniref:1-deoxy-D-xylulose-5-phosphate synthase n=1 Tax=Ferrithrix thermotolerans DSM 19514 TaxID=1121881 RepID=A0A1M4UKK1_9ACTN|nr:1-deoxy-D-xylulose-5-phosphate synthase [Ferrithrix thermotolerans]SHE57185.1 1-deoxy-D-xylulose-5-phosphate synthase [Ferrithrix thermotolerans DSM 19514]
MWLEKISSPSDIRNLEYQQISELCQELREFLVDTVTTHGGHLGSNLGVVELTVALHRVFESPKDILLFDTGHQAYIHKLLTGRASEFETLRTQDGLSGYPKRAESEHDWIENSHASTALSYAYGLAASMKLGRGPMTGEALRAESKDPNRRVVAVVGDGALTGGMAYEALNNIGHAQSNIIIIWNDNGRSYAPTISRLSQSITKIRLHPSYMQARNRLGKVISEIPAVGGLAATSWSGFTAALREAIEPRVFFEALGVRYTGPVDGHDVAELEYALQGAKEWQGPIVVHVLTQKGRGYAPAEDDEINRLHDLKVRKPSGNCNEEQCGSYTETFSKHLLAVAESRPEVVAITAAMPAPTGLLPFSQSYPDRFFDVGIAEQHAVTGAAGMAMGGLRPVVAIYSTFLSRAFDQVNLDVALHRLPVCFVIDRAGITGDDGPSHHGVLDLVQMLSVPDLCVFAPSSLEELERMIDTALTLPGPSSIRFPKTPGPLQIASGSGEGLRARKLISGSGEIAVVGVGKMVLPAYQAAIDLASKGVSVTLWDPRCIRPLDQDLLEDLSNHRLVLTFEDGFVNGGAGDFIGHSLREVAPEVDVFNYGVPVEFIAQGDPEGILSALKLDKNGIADTIWAAYESALVKHTSEKFPPLL